jgi:hypothetical protein
MKNKVGNWKSAVGQSLTLLIAYEAFFVAATPNAVAGPRSIVGAWRSLSEGGDCSEDGGRVTIRPMSITQHGESCLFTSVTRVGDEVTWQGKCLGLESWAGASTVLARLSGETLTIRYGRGYSATYSRCPK